LIAFMSVTFMSALVRAISAAGTGKGFTTRRRFMLGLCEKAKVKPMGFHALRRYFASKLVENREDLETIRQLMGHDAVSTTDRYIYRLKSDLRSAVEDLG